MTAPGHPLDVATRLEPQQAGLYRGETSPHYANMVGPFGGVIAAKVLSAVLLHPARLGEPVAFTVNYAGPIADGEFAIEARPARTNRSTQHWTIELRQQDQIAVTATAICAARRETWSSLEAQCPEVPGPDALPSAPTEGRPRWTRAYDMRFAKGGLDFSPGAEERDSVSTLWVRDEPPRPLDYLSLVAIADVFFPRLFVRRPRWVPIGTVSFTTYFHADAAMLAAVGPAHVLASARALQFRNGYFDQSAEIWSRAGALLASSHQLVYFKE